MKKKHKSIYDLLGVNTSLGINKEAIQSLNNSFKYSPFKEKNDNNYTKLHDDLVLFLKQYSPVDIVIAINTIELWPPNISSLVKQSILVNAFLSIKENDFKYNKAINNYDEFCKFSSYLINLLPTFPMLEDFVPEIDWGEVKFNVDNQYFSIFYGGCIERVPDFLQSFLIIHGDKREAIVGMLYALELQDYIINQLKHIVNLPKNVRNGHIEIPNVDFWIACRQVITNTSDYISVDLNGIVTRLGKERTYSSLDEFTNAFMQSQINQSVFVEISKKPFPFSIRNSISIVIDKWAPKSSDPKEVSFRLLDFINHRLETLSELPLQLFDAEKIYSSIVTSVFYFDEKFYFVVILDDDEDTAGKLENDLQNALQSEYWGFKKLNSPYAFNVKERTGDMVSREQIEILYVAGGASTAAGYYSPPKSGIVFPFPEFISVFDSIENADELVKFLGFIKKHERKMHSSVVSLVDKFATFKDSNGILEKGATTYDIIALDPHSGSNWRYKYLANYWQNLIVDFPDTLSKWTPRSSYDDIQFLSVNDGTKYTWSTKVLNTSIHFLVKVDEFINLPQINGRMLNFFAESTTDALSQRRNIISQLVIVNQYQTIIFKCLLDKNFLIDDKCKVGPTSKNFFDNLVWWVDKGTSKYDKRLEISLSVNILAMKTELDNSINSEFQGNLAKKIINIIHEVNKSFISDQTIKILEESYKNQTRVALGTMKRAFDSLESFHILPKPEHYIIARKELAEIIRNKGYEKKRYELAVAKDLINDISSDYLSTLLKLLSKFDKDQLLISLLENYDAYINFKHHHSYRALQSLEHEVAFNREESVYELQSEFDKNSNHHRYIIERLVANKSSGCEEPSKENILLILAYVDWLMTLYSASDVIHHGIEVGGIEIDSEYIPQVFFSEKSGKFDHEFGIEQAGTNLGIGVNESDEVIGEITEKLLNQINVAFMADLGFSFTTLAITLDVLQSWADINQIDLENHYCASFNKLISVCLKEVSELQYSNEVVTEQEIREVINFLTLDADRVVKKLGSDEVEFDVPVLEYNKRDQRLNIKPLIKISNDSVLWSAGCAFRTRKIWLARISEGCLPANFSWKSVNTVVDSIKKDIEKKLELVTFEIFNRYFHSNYCHHGIDFKRKFKKEGFDDVGDYDVLTYIPQSNTWIMVECKYNQTPYCLQDMKRLRNRVFDEGRKTHVPKILKRHDFLIQNHNKICELLGYVPNTRTELKIVMLYIARQIYWIHRNPPIPTEIEFIQVDKLDNWLIKNKDQWLD